MLSWAEYKKCLKHKLTVMFRAFFVVLVISSRFSRSRFLRSGCLTGGRCLLSRSGLLNLILWEIINHKVGDVSGHQLISLGSRMQAAVVKAVDVVGVGDQIRIDVLPVEVWHVILLIDFSFGTPQLVHGVAALADNVIRVLVVVVTGDWQNAIDDQALIFRFHLFNIGIQSVLDLVNGRIGMTVIIGPISDGGHVVFGKIGIFNRGG